MWVKKPQLEPDTDHLTGSKLGKEYDKAAFNLYAEYIMQNARLDEVQAGIKTAGRNIIISDMHMTPPLWQKVKRN